jgi:Polyketide cyclase / dehydrase and lipid transport
MISIAGAARRSYTFPAPLDAAFAFNADLDRMLGLLPHIAVVGAPSPSTRRLCYAATESRLYRVRIHCTVVTEIDAGARRIRITPTADPARAQAGFRSMSGRGRYDSTIRFHPQGDATRIDYELELGAELPVAGSLRLIPTAMLDASAERIFRRRLDEILDGFVQRSIAAYARASAKREPDSATVRASRDHRA